MSIPKLKGEPLVLVSAFGAFFFVTAWSALAVGFISKGLTVDFFRGLMIFTPVAYVWYKATEDTWNKKENK